MNPDRDLTIDMAKFDRFWPVAYPRYARVPLVTRIMRRLVKDDLLQLGQLFEKALSQRFGLLRDSTCGRDFATGDDAKCVVVRWSNRGQTYSANVCNTHRKTGDLLVAVYERLQKKWYYFRIPHPAYRHVPKTSNIDIPFELDGTPRRQPLRAWHCGRPVNNWWQWECQFQELGAKQPH